MRGIETNMTATAPPLIFLAFANDHSSGGEGYLRNLPKEADKLETALTIAAQNGLCEVLPRQNVTIRKVLDIFADQRHRNRIAIFHFGGHANGYQLLLQTDEGEIAAANAAGFAEFLGQQLGLELVFLNGCSTEQQAQALLDAGVAMVIATAQAIDDGIATAFASRFYTGLGGGATIQSAFDSAVAAIKIEQGREPASLYRHFHFAGADAALLADRWPWALYVRAGAGIAKTWNLPDAAKDPLFGLPPLPVTTYTDLPDSPFLPLQSFQDKDAALFFGRGAEIRDLYTRVTTPSGEPIVLLYGQSGVGKSSLLAAGLLPRLQSKHTVDYARRDQTLGLLGTLQAMLQCKAPDCDDLTMAWHSAEERIGQPLTLILDQVEEYEIRPEGDHTAAEVTEKAEDGATTEEKAATPPSPEMTNFLRMLEPIFVKCRAKPQGKLILSFRKEWLADIRAALHAHRLPFVEVYLDRLDRNGVIEAVQGVTKVDALRAKYNVTIEAHLPVVIADDLLADPGSAVAPTLQFLLSRMWKGAKALAYQAPVFTQALYEALRGKSLDDFLGDQLTLLAADFPAAYASGLLLDLLYSHVTPEVTAGQHTHEELCQLYREQPSSILTLVQRCQDLYLLTDAAHNQPTTQRSSRLAHDTLASLIRKRFDESDAPGQRARRTLANRAVDWHGGKSGAPLDDYDLDLVERGEPGMRAWTADEQRLIDESRWARQERIRAAKAAAEREQRARQRVRLVGAIGALLVLLISIGFSMRVLFEQSSTLAEKQEAQQNESRLLAARALEQVTSDPVAALQLSLAALPAPDHPRPYVPAAEFALIRALQTSMERGYHAFGATPLTADRVAFAPDRSTLNVAAGDGLWQLAADLTAPPVLRNADAILGLRQREDGLLLAYEKQVAHVWLDEATAVNSPTLEAEITCAQWRPQYEQVALCVGDRLLLWSYRTGTVQSVDAIKLNRSLRDIAWSPSGEQLAITGNSAPAELWSVGDITATNRLTVGSDIGDLAFVNDERFVTWSFKEQRTQLWDIAGHALLTYTVATDQIQGFALSPDRTELLLYLSSSDMERRNVTNGAIIGERLSGHELPAKAAVWSPSGDYLATSANDGTVRIWALQDNTNLVTLRGHFATTNLGRIDVNGVYWQDNTHLITHGEDGTVRRWQVFADNGLPLCAGSDARSGDPHCYNFSSAVDVGAETSTAATWLDPQQIVAVRMALIDNPAHRFTFDGSAISRTHTITNVEGLYPQMIWSPDGHFVLTYVPENEFTSKIALRYGRDGIIRDGHTGVAVGRIRGPIAQAFWLPPGTLVNAVNAAPESAILVSRESGETLLFDPTTRQRVATITGHTQKLSVATVYTPTQQLATADRAGLLQIWDLQQDRPRVLQRLASTLPEQLPIQELVWNRDGTRLLAAGSKVTLWDTQSGHVVWPTNDLQYDASHVAFSPTEAYVAVTVNQALLVLQADNGQLIWQQLDAHADPIVGVRWLTGAPWPNQVADDWFSHFLARLNGTYRTFQQDRLLLLTWGGDGTARLWDWQSQSEVARFADVGTLTVARFDPTEAYLLTAGQGKTLRIWRSWHQDPAALLAAAQSRLTRELTTEQLQRFALPTPTATP